MCLLYVISRLCDSGDQFEGVNAASSAPVPCLLLLKPLLLVVRVFCLLPPVQGFVIVETNFKVYAHTGSQFQTELLSLFLRPEICLPNLVIGEINRETAMKAFDAGITADQVSAFLAQRPMAAW